MRFDMNQILLAGDRLLQRSVAAFVAFMVVSSCSVYPGFAPGR
jgi:hypothetical protein